MASHAMTPLVTDWSMHRCDVAVIGAGLAGLSAARSLLDRGRSVLVLEARDRVGGRLLGRELADGSVVELGGQWVGPTQLRVNAWIDELGLARFETYDEGFNQFESRGRRSRYRGAIPRLSPVVLADVAQAQARLDRMARQVPLDAPWQALKAAEWDSQTVATWVGRHTHTRGARDFFALLCTGVWAAEPADLSLLHLLFYAHSAGGINRLISTDGGAQQHRISGGSQLIAERAAALVGDRILLSSPVRRIVDDGESVAVQGDGFEVKADQVVVAIPPTLAGRLDYVPPLPGWRDQLTQRIPQGSVIKCMAVYDAPFWRAEGLSGQVASTAGPVTVAFDNSPDGSEYGVLLGFLEGEHARTLGRAPVEERRGVVLSCFERFFGARARAPREYVEHSWAEEEFTRGCYGGYFAPGVWTSLGFGLRKPVGRISWAGAETAEIWNGYMDGAISSGERAADEIIAAGRRPRAHLDHDPSFTTAITS
jgi:monoamine oxidase